MEEKEALERTPHESSSAESESNAYVGPVPVPRDRRIYGRKREITMAVNRLLFDRVLLVYSPSGAGKTSVIAAQNGILHQMRQEGVSTSPIIRVSFGAATAVKNGVNRYLFSTLRSLDPQGTADEEALARRLRSLESDFFSEELNRLIERKIFEAPQVDPEQFADPSLIPPRPPLLLIFDQFEELLTLDPIDEPAKKEFLQQVGQALKSRDRLALFAMREDFVAGLDPFLALLPSRLSAVLRLDFLAKKDAEDAVKKPPQDFPAVNGQKVTFDDEACEKLLNELLTIRVQDPVSGVAKEAKGLYVEPLHLQVVCSQLWTRRTDPTRITVADLDNLRDTLAEELTGVDAAMASYYTKTIKDIAAQFPPQEISERNLRNWFGRVLISPDGLRLSTLLGKEKECHLTAEMLRALDKRFLIRAEQRHNMTYYEVAHDRFVEPIRKSNQAWKRDLGSFQQAAELWHENVRRDDFVVVGKVLEEGEKLFKKRQAGEFSEVDRDFLDACRKVRQREREREEMEAARREAAEMKAEASKREYELEKARSEAAQRHYELEKANREATELRAAAAENDVEMAILKAEEEKTKFALERSAQWYRLLTTALLLVVGAIGFVAYYYYTSNQSIKLNNNLTTSSDLKSALEKFNLSLAYVDSDPPKSYDLLKNYVEIFRKYDQPIDKGINFSVLPTLYANRTMRLLGTKESPAIEESRHFTTVTDILAATAGEKQWIITRDADGLTLCWRNDGDGTQFKSPRARVHTVTKCAVTQNGKNLVVGHSSGQVCRWDLSIDAPDYTIVSYPQDSPVISLDVQTNGMNDVFAAVAWKYRIRLLNTNADKPLAEWTPQGFLSQRVFVAPDGNGALVAGSQGAHNWLVSVLPTEDSSYFLELPQISRTASSPDHSTIVFACEDPIFDLCALPSMPRLPVQELPFEPLRLSYQRQENFTYRIPALAVSGKIGTGGESLVAVVRESLPKRVENSQKQNNLPQAPTQECFLVRVTKEKLEPLAVKPGLPQDLTWSARVLAFSNDGKWFAAGFQDGTTCVWSTDAKEGWKEPYLVLRTGVWEGDQLAPSAAITALGFLPRTSSGKDSKKPWLFTGQADGTLRRWDLDQQVNLDKAIKNLMADGVLPKEGSKD